MTVSWRASLMAALLASVGIHLHAQRVPIVAGGLTHAEIGFSATDMGDSSWVFSTVASQLKSLRRHSEYDHIGITFGRAVDGRDTLYNFTLTRTAPDTALGLKSARFIIDLDGTGDTLSTYVRRDGPAPHTTTGVRETATFMVTQQLLVRFTTASAVSIRAVDHDAFGEWQLSEGTIALLRRFLVTVAAR
jgi:hypothetical protein